MLSSHVLGALETKDLSRNRGEMPQTPWKATRCRSVGLSSCLSNIYTLRGKGASDSNLLPLETAYLAECLGIHQASIVDLFQFCTVLT